MKTVECPGCEGEGWFVFEDEYEGEKFLDESPCGTCNGLGHIEVEES